LNELGTSAKLDWAEDHANLFDEHKEDNEFLFIYTDSSLSYKKGTCKMGYGVMAYWYSEEINMENGALGKFIEVYDVEMKALKVASSMLLNLFNNADPAVPSRIVISSDNMGALHWIFQGSPGKAQEYSLTFHRNILNLLDQHINLHIALTWCPGHFNIKGNERADELAKSGSFLIPKKPNYKSLSYVGSLHKCEIGEEWLHRWTNSHTSLCSKFHIAN